MEGHKKKLIKAFLIKAILLFIIWQVGYHMFLKPNGAVDNTLTSGVVSSSVYGLNLIGFDTTSKENVIFIGGQQSVLVANACNGLELIALFVGFLICFPGKIISKIIYGIVGSMLLMLINVFREVALALNYNYFSSTFDLNHKYTYTLIVYACVFFIWKHWIENYSIISKVESK